MGVEHDEGTGEEEEEEEREREIKDGLDVYGLMELLTPEEKEYAGGSG